MGIKLTTRQFVELHMPKFNAPQRLIDFAQSLSKKSE
jgi:pyruvate decarboxylase